MHRLRSRGGDRLVVVAWAEVSEALDGLLDGCELCSRPRGRQPRHTGSQNHCMRTEFSHRGPFRTEPDILRRR